jgi:hypothetical protein
LTEIAKFKAGKRCWRIHFHLLSSVGRIVGEQRRYLLVEVRHSLAEVAPLPLPTGMPVAFN